MKRVPPNSIEAEQEVLGCILQHEEALDTAIAQLVKDDYYDTKHRLVYEAICKLHADSKPVDLTTVSNQLQRDNHLQKVGGRTFIASLTEIGVHQNVDSYIRIVLEKSYLRRLYVFLGEARDKCLMDNDTAEKIIDSVESQIMSMSLRSSTESYAHVKEIIPDTLEDLENAVTGKKEYIKTGFTDWDNLTVGLTPSDLIIIAGRPGMGKSAVAMNIAENVAMNGIGVGVFSLEMSKEQLTKRIQYGMARVSGKKADLGKITSEEMDMITHASNRLAKLPIYIDDTAILTPSVLRSKARRLVSKHKVKLIIVDYIQLMVGKGGNRTEEVGDISRALKLLAKELNVPVIALSQLSRAVESRNNKRPQLSDLRESGSIEQDADEVVFTFRPEEYMKHVDDDDPKKQEILGLAEIIIDKNRDGETGIVKLSFIKEYARFENRVVIDI